MEIGRHHLERRKLASIEQDPKAGLGSQMIKAWDNPPGSVVESRPMYQEVAF